MDRRDAYKTTTGTAEELLLQGDRYRDAAFGSDDIETPPFLGGDEDELPQQQTQQKPTRKWGWRQSAWMTSKGRPPRHYQPVNNRDEEDGGIALSDDETDVEAGVEADEAYNDDPTAATRSKQRHQNREDSHDAATEDDDADNDSHCHRRIPGATWYQAQRPGGVIALVAMLLFFLIFAATLALVPMMRLIEDAFCRKYYGLDYGSTLPGGGNMTLNTHKQFLEDDRSSGGSSNGTDERMCKVDAVQAELAWLGGVVSVTEAILGLLVSFPWALLSDRIGRKPVFRIAFVGVSLSFGWTSLVLLRRDVLSVWWVLTSEVFLLIGGGGAVAVTILHAIVADVLVADRASGFIWLSTGAVAGSIVGPASAALLMMKGGSAWLPIGLTLFVLAPTVLVLTVFLPETLPKSEADLPSPSFSPSSASSSTSFWTGTIPAHLRETLTQLQKTVVVLRRSRAALLLLPTFLFYPAMTSAQGGILAQSVSKRFGWSLAQTGYLFSFRGLVTVLVLILIPIVSKYILVGVPAANHKRRGLGMSETSKDLLLARASLVCLVLGNGLMAAGTSLGTLVAGLVVSTLAVGLSSVTRSLITHYFVEEAKHSSESADSGGDDHTSRLYTLTGMVETAGSVLAGPLLAWTFSSGLALGGGWIGLPFYYVGGLCVAALVCLLLVGDGGELDTSSSSGGRIRLSTTTDSREETGIEEGEMGSGRIALP